MADDYGYDLVKTVILAGAGIFALYAIDKFFKLRGSPILIGGVTAETATKQITVDIPEFWVPYQPGDSKDSVKNKYTPAISIDSSNYILTFNKIQTNIGGITTSYTPDPIKIPFTNTITMAQLAVKLTPSINATVDPVGWNIKFPAFVLLA